MVVLKYKKVHPDALLEAPKLEGDVGYDLSSIEEVSVVARQSRIIRTGIILEIPRGYYIEARTRSGYGMTKNLQIHPGIIDEGFRGEITVKIFNHGDETRFIPKGSRIAQLILHKSEVIPLQEVSEVSSSLRGERKWGSTGK